MTRARPGHIITINVEGLPRACRKGREITLTQDEMVEVHQQAWRRHRTKPGHRRLVALRANLAARILGRKAHHNSRCVYTADADTDDVTCGRQRVWKTGGRQVVEWIMAHTSEEDLALSDYVEQLMWLSHCCNLAAAGHPTCPEHAPKAWRDGEQMPEDEYRAMLQRLDACHEYSQWSPGAMSWPGWRHNPPPCWPNKTQKGELGMMNHESHRSLIFWPVSQIANPHIYGFPALTVLLSREDVVQ